MKYDLVARHLFDYHADGLVEAVQKACQPAKYPVGHPLHDYEAFYGPIVFRAVWQAKFVMREARRLGLLDECGDEVRVLVELDVYAGDPA